MLRNHYLPSPSWLLLGKKKTTKPQTKKSGRKVVEVMLGSGSSVSCSPSWCPVEAFFTGLDHPPKKFHCLHSQASPLQPVDALTVSKKKKKREMVSALCMGCPYDFLRCSLLSMTGCLSWNCEQGSSN